MQAFRVPCHSKVHVAVSATETDTLVIQRRYFQQCDLAQQCAERPAGYNESVSKLFCVGLGAMRAHDKEFIYRLTVLTDIAEWHERL
jgi:hypothetical protein